MAAGSAISPSYLNHLERNQRPVTAGLLLKLAEPTISTCGPSRPAAAPHGPDELAEIFADPMFSDLGVPRYELTELAHNAPGGRRRHRPALRGLKRSARNPSLAEQRRRASLVTPDNWVRDYIQAHRNHYPDLEEAAETLGGALAIRCRWPSRCGAG